ncbi:cation:dicarboxylase symporter family transporter [Trinickia terrae]|uniref:Cation:dicarboxylase symporter family transporter n=1 Tax=Trinickia terrae TaxID=2571161 RepID=A0A4U1I3M5_9BURK|nr:cation:dicarboxylase symporter family transporter [Trinickia terrae]TKC87838.1 cation:dicarboxylase symporter family transporter [Trinickia terrae]
MSELAVNQHHRWYRGRTFHVLVAVLLGILVGHFFPNAGTDMKPLADIFVRLIKMVIGPIVFIMIVTGISGAGDLRKAGRIGLMALVYFEIVTTVALALGMLVSNLAKPGAGIVVGAIAKSALPGASKAASTTWVDTVVAIFPDNAVKAFVNGDLVPIIAFSIFFGCSLSLMGIRGKPIEEFFERFGVVLFGIIKIVMKYAPIAAFSAIAFSVGKYGLGSLLVLGKLVGYVYLTMAFFVFVVLGLIARLNGLSLWRLLKYCKEELVLVLGTVPSETVLPTLMAKLEALGVSKRAVGLVMPTGYSFNQIGAAIYLSMSVLFIAQVYGVELGMSEQIGILLVLMLTSKGSAGVTGSAFVVLASTVAATHVVPVEGVALLLGVEQFMSIGRATLTVIGNLVATVVVGKMAGEFDSSVALECYKKHFEDASIVRI